jgi:hypothetical protein
VICGRHKQTHRCLRSCPCYVAKGAALSTIHSYYPLILLALLQYYPHTPLTLLHIQTHHILPHSTFSMSCMKGLYHWSECFLASSLWRTLWCSWFFGVCLLWNEMCLVLYVDPVGSPPPMGQCASFGTPSGNNAYLGHVNMSRTRLTANPTYFR